MSEELKDEDGLDIIQALVLDAAAVEGVANVHEGSSYYAERLIRRAIEQGNLKVVGPANHPAALTAMPATGMVTEAIVREAYEEGVENGIEWVGGDGGPQPQWIDSVALLNLRRAMIAAAPGSELKEEGGV